MLLFNIFFNFSDERIPLVLWGNAACDVNYAIQVRSEYTTICVLRFGKINVWNGNYNNAFLFTINS